MLKEKVPRFGKQFKYINKKDFRFLNHPSCIIPTIFSFKTMVFSLLQPIYNEETC